MENRNIVRKIFLYYLGGLSMLDVYGYLCNVYAYIRIQIIVEIKTIIEALVRVFFQQLQLWIGTIISLPKNDS